MKHMIAWVVAGISWVAVARAQAPTGENVMLPVVRVNAVANFVAPGMFDFAKLLPEPPADDTLAGRADLAVVRQVQAWRTEEQIAWAKWVDKDAVFNHASVVGAWFAAEKLPRTAEFFQRLGDDLRALDAAAKQPFLRARPTTVDADVQPCVPRPASTSYPSGSAMQAFIWAELLAEALPAQREALLARARRAAWGRVIGGVHFPSDLVGGEILAAAVVAECRRSAAFRMAWGPARAEIAAAAR